MPRPSALLFFKDTQLGSKVQLKCTGNYFIPKLDKLMQCYSF